MKDYKMENKVTLENSLDLLEMLDETYSDIPMENSDFQIKNFVINSSITPERAFRSIGLNLRSLLERLNDAYIELLQREDLIEKLQKEYDEAENDDNLSQNEKIIKKK